MDLGAGSGIGGRRSGFDRFFDLARLVTAAAASGERKG